MRHAHFRVGAVERDRWYEHMTAALAESHIDAALQKKMLEYFSMPASHLVITAHRIGPNERRLVRLPAGS